MNKVIRILLILCLTLTVVDVFGQGCAQCKLLSEQGSELEESSFGSNINIGILYLMFLPYILLLVLFRKRIFTFLRSLPKKTSK
ncbi:MAG: hypothetical protein HYR91_03770 [Flavobacteriia bacterium]|nr:hypothetical protein [Flavobacteriia bacterium]